MEKSLHLAADDGTGGPHSSLPLKISFSSLRIRRSDPAERGLVKLLPGASDGARHDPGPIVYPIFGRGRILAVLTGEQLNTDTLQDMGDSLCGNCSCILKGQLPGGDLLMAASWETILQGEAISEDSPALRGLGPLAQAAAAAAAARTPPAAVVASIPSPLAAGQQAVTADPPRHSALLVSLLATLLAAVVLIAAGSVLLKNLHRKGAG
jgi:hypothetical protein